MLQQLQRVRNRIDRVLISLEMLVENRGAAIALVVQLSVAQAHGAPERRRNRVQRLSARIGHRRRQDSNAQADGCRCSVKGKPEQRRHMLRGWPRSHCPSRATCNVRGSSSPAAAELT